MTAIAQVASAKIPRLIAEGVRTQAVVIEQVSRLNLKVNQLVLARTFSNEEILGTIQLISGTCGPHDKVRLISGARVLNLSASQILAILRVPR